MDTILDKLTPEKATDEQVIAQAVKVAKSFSQLWNDYSKWLVELKTRFGVRQGSRGKQLPIEGKMLYWDDFCDVYLNTTADNFKHYVQRENQQGFSTTARKPLERRPDYIKGKQAGIEEERNRQLTAGVDVKASVPKPEKVTAVLTKGEKDNIAMIASRKAAVIADEIYQTLSTDRGMTHYDIQQVITELQKLNKPTLVPMSNRFQTQAVAAA
jgi:hypothetical protein